MNDNNYLVIWNTVVDSVPILVIKFAFEIIQNEKAYVKVLVYKQEGKGIYKETENF